MLKTHIILSRNVESLWVVCAQSVYSQHNYVNKLKLILTRLFLNPQANEEILNLSTRFIRTMNTKITDRFVGFSTLYTKLTTIITLYINNLLLVEKESLV